MKHYSTIALIFEKELSVIFWKRTSHGHNYIIILEYPKILLIDG